MRTKIAFTTLMLPLVFSCGEKSSSSGNSQSPQQTSFTVAAVGDLPVCNSDRKGALAYVKSESQFYTCEGSWEKVSIKGEKGDKGDSGVKGDTGATGSSGLSIGARYRYHTDSYASATNISSESASTNTYIGTIELLKYSDGTAQLSVMGNMTSTTSGSQTFSENFSHVISLTASSSEQEKVVKYNVYADSRIRYKINLGVTPPTFKAVVDVNGNFGDNTDTSFTLAAQ